MAVNRSTAIAIVLMGLIALAHVSEAQTKCPSNALIPLASCLSYVRGSTMMPSAACCGAVKAANIDCVCKAYTSGNFPPGVKKQLVLSLPKKCNKSIRKGYKCAGITL